MKRGRFETSAALRFAIGSIALAGCASGVPLLVEPRVGEPGDVAFQFGGAATAPIGALRDGIAPARVIVSSSNDTNSTTSSLATVAGSLAAPAGVAPFLRGAVAIAPELQLSVRATGRDVGLGGRWLAIDERTEKGGATTLSFGAEATSAMTSGWGGEQDGDVVVHDARVLGANVPVILAWQSDAGLVLAYAGATLGLSHGSFDASYASDSTAQEHTLSFTRWSAAVTGGLGVGFRRVHLIVELGVERSGASITIDHASAGALDGWILRPGFALSLRL